MSEDQKTSANPAPEVPSALPLEELELTPQWVKTAAKSYADHKGDQRPERKRFADTKDRRRHGGDRDRGRPDKKSDRDNRKTGPHDHRIHPKRATAPRDRDGRHPAPRTDRKDVLPRRQQQPPEPVVEVLFFPEEKGFAAMIEAMKHSPRAYALFDVAKLVLNKPERHVVKLARKADASGSRAPLFLVIPSENPLLSQDEAVQFVFRNHAEMVFRENKRPVDPPKGNFTFVNRCGLTGEWLGPPNYHEYQTRLIHHHQSKLAHVPFEQFKARIQTVKDPEAVKAWVDSMSVKTEYECVLDTEPKTFNSFVELEKHFVDNHLARLIRVEPEIRISGIASRQVYHRAILESIRLAWESERRFPLKTANGLRGRLRHEGFHFFKHRKGITYISKIKPKRFESTEGLTEHIQKIITFLRAHNGAHRKQLLNHFLAPNASHGETPSGENVAPQTPSDAHLSQAEEQLLADLHWLIQDGYVVEFSDGRLWALEDKPPQPKPPAAETQSSPPEPTSPEKPAEEEQPQSVAAVSEEGTQPVS